MKQNFSNTALDEIEKNVLPASSLCTVDTFTTNEIRSQRSERGSSASKASGIAHLRFPCSRLLCKFTYENKCRAQVVLQFLCEQDRAHASSETFLQQCPHQSANKHLLYATDWQGILCKIYKTCSLVFEVITAWVKDTDIHRKLIMQSNIGLTSYHLCNLKNYLVEQTDREKDEEAERIRSLLCASLLSNSIHASHMGSRGPGASVPFHCFR